MLKKQDLEFNQRFMTVLFKPTVSRFTILFKFKIFNQNYNKILQHDWLSPAWFEY